MAFDLQLNVALAMGQITNLVAGGISGLNTSVNATQEDIWEGGGSYTFLSAAEALEVVSSSASDAAAGVGARAVLVDGVDSTGASKQAVVSLNGTTPVAAGSFLAVNRAVVLSSGSSAFNVGTLTVRTVAAATAQCIILPERGLSQMFIYTVPLGWSLMTGSLFFATGLANGGVSGGHATQLILYGMNHGTNTWLARAEFLSNDFVSTTELVPAPAAAVSPERTRLRLAGVCATASMIVTAGMRTVLIRNGSTFAPRFTSWAGVG